MKRVSVFMDVEDPINPRADDAALDFARLFTETGIKGSFCLTGEKCRTLVRRDRTDVIKALTPHCLGLHTDTHSFHPTTMELLADLPFEKGCAAAYAAEAKGFEAFGKAFGRPPTFWGGAGNTWSPEITDALWALGVAAYAYALTELPHRAVHRFNGVTALPQALSISETDFGDASRATAEADRVLRELKEIDQPWIGIFVGHPTRFRHLGFWDEPYAHGRTPPVPEYTEPAPADVYARGKRNLRAFLGRLKRHTEIVGVDDALALPWRFRNLTDSEVGYFRTHTAQNLRGAVNWPIHHPSLDPRLIVDKTLALTGSVECGFLETN